MLSEKQIEEIYGKSIWEMTPQEMADNELIHTWAVLVDLNANEE